jgi:plasmanylethanolamine desaturase
METACILTAVALFAVHAVRFARSGSFWSWPFAAAILLGALSADFVSGMVHWFCDTWFEETMPFLGRRFLRPFRVHHVNPDDFLRRNFVDTNGDVSMLVIPILAAALLVPIDGALGRWIACYLFAFGLVVWPTNQVHQWAHMPAPPRQVAMLQRLGVILSRPAHRRHHVSPYATNYCIATGWMNRPLAAIDFFRRLEALITRTTGLEPRVDDSAFVMQVRLQEERS